MGNYLSSPNSFKRCEDGRLAHVKYAVCAMQGWRITMEDSHIVHMFEYLPPPAKGPSALFGVYDGHGGPHVAQFVSRHLVEEFLKTPELLQGHFEEAFRSTYIALDSLLRQDSSQAELEWFSRSRTHFADEDSNTLIQEKNENSLYPPPPLITPAEIIMKYLKEQLDTFDGEAQSTEELVSSYPKEMEELPSLSKRQRFRASVRFRSRRLYRKSQEHFQGLKKKKKKKNYEESKKNVAKTPESNKDLSPPNLESPPISAIISPSLLPIDDETSCNVCDEQNEVAENHFLNEDIIQITNKRIPGKTFLEKLTTQSSKNIKNKKIEETRNNNIKTNSPDMESEQISTSSHLSAKSPDYSTFSSSSTSSLSYEIHPNNGMFQNLKSLFTSLLRFGSSSVRSQNSVPYGHAMLAGCTATSVLLTTQQIIVANAGDSRAVLCRGTTALELSKDHKPTLPEEKARIYTAGGWLEMGRINGNLNLSRAVGDLIYKSSAHLPPEKQIVSSVPDVISERIQENDEFLVVGCDGIWESSSSQEIVNFVLNRINKTTQLSEILEALFEKLLSPNPTLFECGCDNMTAILIDLKPDARIKKPSAPQCESLNKIINDNSIKADFVVAETQAYTVSLSTDGSLTEEAQQIANRKNKNPNKHKKHLINNSNVATTT